MSHPFFVFVKYASRFLVPYFFKNMEVIGLENVPNDAGVIVVANHQNAFLDAVIIGSLMKGPTHFLARSDVFKPPFDQILTALNMMPIYRIRDGYEKLAKNDEIFAKCISLLRSQKRIGIFPEGNAGPGYHLRGTSKGTARMALQSQDVIDQSIYVMPVGLNYYHHNTPRQKLVVHFGSPIDVSEYIEDYHSQGPKTIVTLKKRIVQEIKALLLVPDQDELYDSKVQRVRRIDSGSSYKSLKQELSSGEVKTTNEIEHVEYPLLKSIVSIPNWPVLALGRSILKKLKDPQFVLSIKFLLCLFIFPIYWTIILITIGLIWSFPVGLIITATIILCLFIRAEL